MIPAVKVIKRMGSAPSALCSVFSGGLGTSIEAPPLHPPIWLSLVCPSQASDLGHNTALSEPGVTSFLQAVFQGWEVQSLECLPQRGPA